MSSKEILNNTLIPIFLNASLLEQQQTLAQIQINELEGELPLLKKLIVLKVFMEARRAASEHSS